MLRGRFGNTSGRPYLEGRLFIPRLRLHADISFLVDSGSDVTVLHPLDGTQMGIEYKNLNAGGETTGIGGVSQNFAERAIVVFDEAERRILWTYWIDLLIASPKRQIMDLPSVLGRDILDRWTWRYNPSKGELKFRVLSADAKVRLKPP